MEDFKQNESKGGVEKQTPPLTKSRFFLSKKRLFFIAVIVVFFGMVFPLPEYQPIACIRVIETTCPQGKWIMGQSIIQRLIAVKPSSLNTKPQISEPIDEERVPDDFDRDKPWVTYQNTTYGYQFDHPVYLKLNDYKYKNISTGETTTERHMQFDYHIFREKGPPARSMTLGISVIEKDQKLPLKEYLALSESKERMAKMKEVKVNNFDALLLENAGNDMKYHISHGDYIIEVRFDADEEEGKFTTRPEEVIKGIISSFKFNFTPTGVPSHFDNYIYLSQKIHKRYIPKYELLPDGKVHVTSAYGYTVDIPKDWFIKNDFSNFAEFRSQICKNISGGTAITENSMQNLDNCLQDSRYIIFGLLQRNDDNLSLEQWLQKSNFTLDSYGEKIPYNQRILNIDGHRSIEIKPKEYANGIVKSIVYIQLEKSVIGITYYVSGTSGFMEKYRNDTTFEQVLNSIKFNR